MKVVNIEIGFMPECSFWSLVQSKGLFLDVLKKVFMLISSLSRKLFFLQMVTNKYGKDCLLFAIFSKNDFYNEITN